MKDNMEWTSVKDRLPEKNEIILLYTASGKINVGGYGTEVLSKYYPDVDVLECGSIFYGESPLFVTHWMPLPEPPED